MSERKVLNKYFPPDFDPSKLDTKRGEPRTGGGSHVVRLMAPFSMRCLTCSEWIPKGKKFNARKERATGEHYLGIQIHRFYIRCPMCSADITFKTDPEKTDYTCESGAQRNFEMVRDERILEAEIQKEKEEEEARNPISKLESRTLNSKREMEILENLDELKTKSANYERGGSLQAIERIILSKHAKEQEAKEIQEKQDDELAHSVFYNAEGEIVKRVQDGDPLKSLKNQVKHIELKNDLKRKKIDSIDLGIVHKTKKKVESSSLNLLGSVYADSSSDADN